jgi:SAM-dependent methyltransferase
MSRLLGHHTVGSASRRLATLVRRGGPATALSTLLASLDEKYLRCFDRRYRIQTSGIILLPDTSFDRARLLDATQYSPINGWGFRRFLKESAFPRNLHFVDVGCGLGRACIVAAEYGFEKVTGVDLAAEFCAAARRNIARCRPPSGRLSPIDIVQMDALLFCGQTDADLFLMFRPFSRDFTRAVRDAITQRARGLNKLMTVIFTERMLVPDSHALIFAETGAFRPIRQARHWGQAFYVFQCGATNGPI